MGNNYIKTILVTGSAGFIGSCVVETLCRAGVNVVGLDNLNDYYDVHLKEWRINKLKDQKHFIFVKGDIENRDILDGLFSSNGFDAIINLAARAGVRTSLETPHVYATTNVLGNLNLLELCRKYGIKKYVLASTSSLYAGQVLPFREDVPVTTPISPYAATKGSAEAMAYAYHYLYGLDISVLRYFTVYGPAGRPDMSVFRFIKWVIEDRPIKVNGDGTQSRDFTYVSDIAEGTVSALKDVGYEIINLGSDRPYSLNDLISKLETIVGKRLEIQNSAFRKEDMKATWADNKKAREILGWTPKVSFDEGLQKAYDWALENIDLVREMD